MMDVQKEMQQLTEQLLYHARRYYNEDAPEISDFEYDKLQVRLRQLEAEYPQFARPDSPTQRGIGAVLEGSRIPWKACRTYSPLRRSGSLTTA